MLRRRLGDLRRIVVGCGGGGVPKITAAAAAARPARRGSLR